MTNTLQARPTLWEAMMGATVRMIDVGGIRTRVVEAGEGETLVLLHGTGGHVEAFAYNVMPLAAHYHVVVVDMVGHGLTDKPELDYVISDYVDHVVGVLDAMEVSAAHVGGVSLGGWVASFVALHHPDRVLTVINCTGGVFRWPEGQYPEEASQRRHMSSVNDNVSDGVTVESVRRRLSLLFHQDDACTEELVSVRHRLYSDPQMSDILHTLHHMVPYDAPDRVSWSLTEERLRALTRPVFYLWSEHNPGSSVRSARRAAELTARSEVHVMAGCGHWPQWEEPQEFNEQVHRFIGSHGR